MKIVIEIPEKTNAHIRSDYGHGVKGLFDEDREILCDAIYNGTPYEDRPHGEWIRHIDDLYPEESTEECSVCHEEQRITGNDNNFCPNCGADMRVKDELNRVSKELNSDNSTLLYSITNGDNFIGKEGEVNGL